MKSKILLGLVLGALTAGCNQQAPPPARFEIINGETVNHHWLPETFGSSSTYCLKLDRFTGETWELVSTTNCLVWKPVQ